MTLQIYVIEAGDTLEEISRRFGVPAARIAYDNELTEDHLVVGQALIILEPEVVYEVEDGDSISGIAEQFQITEQTLLRNNSFLLDEDFLLPGRELVISYQGMEGREIRLSGYAYSFIRNDTLEESLLYIGELLPFSYGFNEDGTLIEMNDAFLLEQAERFSVGKRMVLTPLDRQERFNNQLVVRLLSEPEVQEALVSNILTMMEEKGYTALDIDFEFIPGQYRDRYVEFVRYTAGMLHERGYEVSVALPPKVSDDQPGLLYEGIDYGGIGGTADNVFLMTYEWGYKYGPPMAIAPVPSVRRVLDYAVTEIPRDRIIMGIPNYAYDWPLPYERGVTVAETIGNREAVERAWRVGAEILYDPVSEAPYYYYTENGTAHVVWFEDVRSIAAKYALVQEYGFAGAGYWNLMREFRQNWAYVNWITGGEET